MLSKEFTVQEKQKLEFASNIVFSYFPHLSGIFRKLDIRFSDRIETAAVTPSGKLLLNRDFFSRLKPGVETAFLLAHELLHLAQKIFERGKGFQDQESLNIAHDVLINELLCETMGYTKPPLDGLSWEWFYKEYINPDWRYGEVCCALPGMKEKVSLYYSLEELVRIIISLKEQNRGMSNHSWKKPVFFPDSGDGPSPLGNHPFADLFAEVEAPSEKKDPEPAQKDNPEPAEKITLDMIGENLEETLFPEEDKASRVKRKNELEAVCLNAAALSILFPSSSCGMGRNAGGCFSDVEIVRSHYSPPWEMAMQRWFDGVAVPKRSWARASRRGAWRSDVVLPGRAQDCFMMHIILDTSGSMTEYIPLLLSQIGSFARNVGMEQVHILQCDTEVADDEFVEIGQLEKYRVNGYGGSDMSPAMLKLAEDPDVTSVLVITDGYIDYPPETDIPYDVLWCIPDVYRHNRPPDYGQVIYVPIEERE